MDVEVARWLVSAAATPWLAQAAAETDPSSPATARRWRRHLSAEQATVVLDQIALRRRAVKKLGDWADQVFLTRDGLEMATRREVARWRARRLVEAGVTSLVDAGTGLGIDAMAAAEAGLAVQGWERDLVLAILAQANLETLKPVAPASVNVHQLDDLTHLTGRPDQALYLDPARRSA
ncbi:MAG: SAM-dependent methyltransferase, partial [Propionibacteriaceae bacterium]|nr:SAM-dependent methyltransferase [Propionibacteriaceae bacterium]